MWSVDRLHPNERGHRFLAGVFRGSVDGAGISIHRRPEPDPTQPPPSRSATARWMLTKGTKWLYDRSGDLVPSLAAMSVKEWWCGKLGLAQPRRPNAHAAEGSTASFAALHPRS